MSEQYPGGFVTRTPPVPNGTTAQGMWTLSQAAGYQKQGLWPVPYIPQYIEDMFQTWLYTGNGSSQTITNGVNLSGNGGMTWIKQRSATRDNLLFDTSRGATQRLFSNLTSAQAVDAQSLTSFNSNGFSIGSDSGCNINGGTYVSWAFREQPKFFDVVTFTSSASGNKTFSHNLGAVPGCVIIKNTQTSDPWIVYHRSVGDNAYLQLNSTAAQDPLTGAFSATSTTFTISSSLMYNSQNYVAYLFAHNAGGFGLSGTDNVISCGSYTGTGAAGNTITLGYEPQWVLIKAAGVDVGWYLADNMRGMPVSSADQLLQPNSSGAEFGFEVITPTATGFQLTTGNTAVNENTIPYIYIAIRRGPMRTPTLGASVFAVNLAPDTSTAPLTWNTNSTVDVVLTKRNLDNTNGNNIFVDRLRGNSSTLETNNTNAQGSNSNITDLTISNGYIQRLVSTSGSGGAVTYAFTRAPSYMDVVCYTGTGSARTLSHNLGAVPEMIIVKTRDLASNWEVYSKDLNALGTETADDSRILLNSTAAATANNVIWNSTPPTATVFSVGASSDSNRNGNTFVAYLFASAPGVSKVGTYTGTGAINTINCGFTAGARFVMVKRTDAAGDWYVFDSARGLATLNNPYILLNSTAAQADTGLLTNSVGFRVNTTGASTVNINGATYIFLAIA